MQAFRYRRHVAVATLTATAAAALIGCQQIIVGTPALTTTTTTTVAGEAANRAGREVRVADSTLTFQKLEAQKATFQNAAFMPAAVSTGTYEELVKPTPVPTAAPATQPAAEAKTDAKAEAAPTQEPEQEAAAIESKPLLYETGIASTYGMGDGFEGMRTGCGGIFHTRVVQVAHKSLPCGTMVRIEDTDTGKAVDAEVTDRGPYVAGRIVDLSYAAFTELDPAGTGLLHVNVYILDTSNQYLYRLRG